MAWVELAWQGVAAQWQAVAVLLPALILAGYWFGVGAALALTPVILWAVWPRKQVLPAQTTPLDRATFVLSLADFLTAPPALGETACFVLQAGVAGGGEALTPEYHAHLMRRVNERLHIALAEDDLVCRLDGDRFAVALCPHTALDTEELIRIAARLQHSCELPFHIGRQMLSVKLACGVCGADGTASRSGAAILARAQDEARRAAAVAPDAIRIAKPSPRQKPRLFGTVGEPLALQFQPRIDSNTGLVSGLAVHPAPLAAEIMATLTPEQICDQTLRHVAAAVAIWKKDVAETIPLLLRLPPHALLTSGDANQILWQIDRYDLAPGHLALIAEDATLTQPTARQTLRKLHDNGCRIEIALGAPPFPDPTHSVGARCLHLPHNLVRHADISAVGRSKTGAIITLAEGLGMETAAEGISTMAELSLLAQLGCTHLAGPAIAPPMPALNLPGWIAQHEHKLRATPNITPYPEARRKE